MAKVSAMTFASTCKQTTNIAAPVTQDANLEPHASKESANSPAKQAKAFVVQPVSIHKQTITIAEPAITSANLDSGVHKESAKQPVKQA
jgi:hypothetical protein